MKKNLAESKNKSRFLLVITILMAIIFTYVSVVFIQKVFDGTFNFHLSTLAKKKG